MTDKEKLEQLIKNSVGTTKTSRFDEWHFREQDIDLLIGAILDWHKEEVAKAERKAELKGYFKAMNDYNKLREEQSQDDTHA